MMRLWFWKDAACAVLLSSAAVLHLEMLLEKHEEPTASDDELTAV